MRTHRALNDVERDAGEASSAPCGRLDTVGFATGEQQRASQTCQRATRYRLTYPRRAFSAPTTPQPQPVLPAVRPPDTASRDGGVSTRLRALCSPTRAGKLHPARPIASSLARPMYSVCDDARTHLSELRACQQGPAAFFALCEVLLAVAVVDGGAGGRAVGCGGPSGERVGQRRRGRCRGRRGGRHRVCCRRSRRRCCRGRCGVGCVCRTMGSVVVSEEET